MQADQQLAGSAVFVLKHGRQHMPGAGDPCAAAVRKPLGIPEDAVQRRGHAAVARIGVMPAADRHRDLMQQAFCCHAAGRLPCLRPAEAVR